jgi:hypothetical protein
MMMAMRWNGILPKGCQVLGCLWYVFDFLVPMCCIDCCNVKLDDEVVRAQQAAYSIAGVDEEVRVPERRYSIY